MILAKENWIKFLLQMICLTLETINSRTAKTCLKTFRIPYSAGRRSVESMASVLPEKKKHNLSSFERHSRKAKAS